MKIYLAGPISGMSYEAAVQGFLVRKKTLEDIGYEVLVPFAGKGYLRNEVELKAHGYKDFPPSTNHAIYERDKWMVSQSDIVYASLLGCGDRISIGTMMELAWASYLGKHTIVTMEEKNVHEHAFVLEAADIRFYENVAAINYLMKLMYDPDFESIVLEQNK